MLRLVCPVCGKLLGLASNKKIAVDLRLWCRRCKAEVTPVVE